MRRKYDIASIATKALLHARAQAAVAFHSRAVVGEEPISELASIPVNDSKYVRKRERGVVFVSSEEPLVSMSGVIGDGCSGFSGRIDLCGRQVPSSLARYNAFLSGAYLEICTDSPMVRIHALIDAPIAPDCMSRNAAVGLDVYEREGSQLMWLACCTPTSYSSPHVRWSYQFGTGKKRVLRIYLPLFAQVRSFDIGLDDASTLYPVEQCFRGAPVAFYGSSITQGCAAARPSLGFPSIVGERLGRESFNFGFSSSARGELFIADEIARLKLDALVVEFDHNVSVEELRELHAPFVCKLRNVNDGVPLLLMTRTSGGMSISPNEERERFEIVKDTYTMLSKAKDGPIALLRGDSIIPKENRSMYFVDDRHPNQTGLNLIAEAVADVLEEEFGLS